jgi:hypothetical protein
MARLKLISTAMSLLLALAGCGGSSGTGENPAPPPPPPPPPPLSMAQAFQLLNQASFGATESEAQLVIDLSIENWIDQQILKEPSLQLPH